MHESIIATTSCSEAIQSTQDWIATLPEHHQSLFAILPSWINGYQTVVLAPNGSNKFWPESDEGDQLRESFKDFIYSLDYEDSSNPFRFVEVSFGEYGQEILD